MEIIKIGRKGQVTLPRRVLEAAGLEADNQLLLEVEPDGSLRLRPAAVYPIESYTDERLSEFERENLIPDALREKADRLIRRRR